MRNPFTADGEDKDNPTIQFTPPVHYTPAEVKAGEQLVEILNNPNLSQDDKKSEVWDVLNNVNA